MPWLPIEKSDGPLLCSFSSSVAPLVSASSAFSLRGLGEKFDSRGEGEFRFSRDWDCDCRYDCDERVRICSGRVSVSRTAELVNVGCGIAVATSRLEDGRQ